MPRKRCETSISQTPPALPRGPRTVVANRSRLLAPGYAARLPDSRQWRYEQRVLLPVTVAGPHRLEPVSVSPVRYVSANLRAALLGGKRGIQLRLELVTSRIVFSALGR